MKLYRLRFVNKKKSRHLGQNLKYPNGYWCIRFDNKTWHRNLVDKTLWGLLKKIVIAWFLSKEKTTWDLI